MDTLAVFRTRSDAIRVYRELSNMRIACATVATPSSLKMGCGLSVVFAGYLTEKVRNVISASGATSFAGFYGR